VFQDGLHQFLHGELEIIWRLELFDSARQLPQRLGHLSPLLHDEIHGLIVKDGVADLEDHPYIIEIALVIRDQSKEHRGLLHLVLQFPQILAGPTGHTLQLVFEIRP
jgi:hypothetical protein